MRSLHRLLLRRLGDTLGRPVSPNEMTYWTSRLLDEQWKN
jgi:hypothetical protein